MSAPATGVAYYRKSNDDAGELGKSIAQQKEWTNTAAPAAGVTIVREFQDQSKSGADMKRPGLLTMIEFCEQMHRAGTPVRYVVTWHTNRLSRGDELDTSEILRRLRAAGTHMILTQERTSDLWQQNDRALLAMTQEFGNHSYLTNLSKDVIRGKRKFAAQGDWGGGDPPYGYKVEGVKLVIDPDKAAVLTDLFEQYAGTDISIRGLARRLFERGIPSPEGKSRWLPATIGKILRNEQYLGDYLFGRKSYTPFATVSVPATVKPDTGRPNDPSTWVRVPGSHPALVTRELFDKVKARLRTNRKRTSNRQSAPWPLTGLLVCGHCRTRMVHTTDRVGDHTYRVHFCDSYNRHGTASGCGRNMVREDLMIAAVAKKLAGLFAGPGAVAAQKAALARRRAETAGTAKNPVPGLRAELDTLNDKIGVLVGRLAEKLPPGVLGDVLAKLDALSDRRNRVREELDRAEATRAAEPDPGEVVDRLAAVVKNLGRVLKTADAAAVSELLHGLLYQVEVFFTHVKAGKQTRSLYANAFVYLSEAWSIDSSSHLNTENRRSC